MHWQNPDNKLPTNYGMGGELEWSNQALSLSFAAANDRLSADRSQNTRRYRLLSSDRIPPLVAMVQHSNCGFRHRFVRVSIQHADLALPLGCNRIKTPAGITEL